MERKTVQRLEIIEVLKNNYNHPTIKELCELVSDKNIGQATVYRTVNSLVNDDVIRRIDCPDGVHYDYRKEHYHFYCLKCNKEPRRFARLFFCQVEYIAAESNIVVLQSI